MQPWVDVGEQLLQRIISDFELDTLFRDVLEQLDAHGLEFERVHIAMSSLHPMFRSYNITWHRRERMQFARHTLSDESQANWLQSPLKALMESDDRELAFDLEVPGEWQRFPVLGEFRTAGATAYLAKIFPFRALEIARERRDGVILSWLSARAGGFSAAERAAIEHLSPRLALASKITKREQTTENIVSAYLGSDPGRRVLDGQIQRGDMDVIPAVIWYSDLRNSTELTESLSGPELLATLNAYFECTAGAVLEHGGDVLRFIGDGVLAIFPVRGAEGVQRWIRVALAAARSARTRLAEVNRGRVGGGAPTLAFGVALHVGDVYFGNIGVPERVEFSVIGPAANEVCRLEELTKTLGEPVVVSDDLARRLHLDWRSLGHHALRGVAEAVEVLAPPAPLERYDPAADPPGPTEERLPC